MAGNIWVVAEHWRGEVSEITYEALALGRELADSLGVKLEAVLLGSGAKGLASTLGKADAVLYGDHSGLADLIPQTYATVLAGLAREKQPHSILVGLTNVSMGLGTLLGAELGSPVVNFCRDASVDGGKLQGRCILYGGKMEATVSVSGELAVVGVWPGARRAEAGRAEGAPPVTDFTPAMPAVAQARLKQYLAPEAGDVDISQQAVLVAVGRGIQNKDNLEMAEELAGILGGAVCGSRPVIDQGWLPMTRQVGKSGMLVKPKLYLALGVSGAPEHQEGMRDSEFIVAVNTDPAAPIFDIAHVGVAADLFDVVPALVDELKAMKG
jgi:electron transfer flavoprotein alpha subunit